MRVFCPDDYGPVFGPLLESASHDGLAAVDPRSRAALDSISLDSAFAPRTIVDASMAQACLAGLWLIHDDLDRSHAISQGIETASGSYWHAIMHRREGDFDNSKYWFRRVGDHPVFAEFNLAARQLAAESETDRAAAYLRDQPAWDPYRFVDLCRDAAGGRTNSTDLCRRIQRAECELLLDHCYSAAVGRMKEEG